MSDSFSLVVPVFNSNDSLTELCSKLFSVLNGHDVEIVLVDDGSLSTTWDQICKLKAEFGDKLIGIRLSKNFGQHNATICGLNFCTKNYIVTIDDDLQFSPDSILHLYKKIKEDSLDIVYGLPLTKQQNPIRIFGHYLLTLFFSLFNEKVTKASAFRIMKKQMADQLKTHRQYFVNIDAVIRWYTKIVGYCHVPHHKRSNYHSGYSSLDLVSVAARGIIAYSAVPLKLFSVLFIVSNVFFVFHLLGYFFNYEGIHWNLPFTNFIYFMLFTFGFSMMFAYFYHITSFLSNKPCYLIAEII